MDDIPDLVTDLTEVSPVLSKSNNKESQTQPEIKKESQVIDKKIPITIITGYLGSGKSTLLEYIGKKSHKRLAIILNEFGDSSAIEKSVTIQDEDNKESVQEWLDIGNGCLCCTVKDNGVLAIENLIENSRGKIDYILLETTGIADPAPVAKMFWLDEGLSSNVYIDGVVTVVDSENIIKCLDDVGGHWHKENNHLKTAQSSDKDELTEEEIKDEHQKLQEGITTAHLQIALADSILINKVDKLEKKGDYENKLSQIENRIRSINNTSPMHPTSFGDIDLEKILDLKAFDSEGVKFSQSLNILENSVYHDDRITTITVTCEFFQNLDSFRKVESFLQYILWENTVNGKEVEIHRTKGIMACGSHIKVIQGVRETYDIIDAKQLAPGIDENKFVFIGKNLSHDDLKEELFRFLE
ncbi:cobW-domain-containing protein [Hyphopichia burtonii NRRL Y-1933]|uniref:CobW-domain-containing protein n=1 Tax=Hyphopichia burtonii NRRL Y-1933 TaxID=984485 RepID=A0A1E4RTC6_9ASCO|nr:cobW-domain-containing protein [Hyphopichia burtonii NRRL Y-1933]ODV70305.1 cobW-domain-containing protein [Hyphopichia burtonii NRRL Y-1933]